MSDRKVDRGHMGVGEALLSEQVKAVTEHK